MKSANHNFADGLSFKVQTSSFRRPSSEARFEGRLVRSLEMGSVGNQPQGCLKDAVNGDLKSSKFLCQILNLQVLILHTLDNKFSWILRT